MNYNILLIIILCTIYSCNKSSSKVTNFDDPPKWAQEAIWYQIFPERFFNGNESNDPTPDLMLGALIDNLPSDWALCKWNSNWYQMNEWEKSTGLPFYRTVQMRRYGGDLDGIIQKIPYLKDLGINAIYLNPCNDAPSLHKYDARSYHHIDITFGDDIEGDRRLLMTENPADPSTWVLTSADRKFLKLIKEMHEAGIKVVLDYSWNHTGTQFWAFQDLLKHQEQSVYKDWYELTSLENKETGAKFAYNGWNGISSLPELKKNKSTEKLQGHPYEGNMPEQIKQHIFAVCKRWIDPNGDGNTEDGIDGMRLDVAEHVPLGFWRDFRKYVRSLNPDFYLIGENWWTKWPDQLMDPIPWVGNGDIFDAVMHYHWARPSLAYFNQGDDKIDLTTYVQQLDSIFLHYKPETRRAMMNLLSSHDAPRFLTVLSNNEKYKFQASPQGNENFYTGNPSLETFDKAALLLIHQFTFVGSPHIWNGDEMGMTGGDDPDNRKPLVWPEFEFDDETNYPFSNQTYEYQPKFNKDWHTFYKSLIKLRKEYISLSSDNYFYVPEYLAEGVFSYVRMFDDEKVTVLINNTNDTKTLKMLENMSTYKPIFIHKNAKLIDGNVVLPPKSALVLKNM